MIFLLTIFLINLGFSFGVYDSIGDYIYYTNLSRPDINLNISSPYMNIFIDYVLLKVGDVEKKIDFSNRDDRIISYIDGIKSYHFTFNDFNMSKNLSENVEGFFDMKVVSPNGNRIKPLGDSTVFKIIYDDKKPELYDIKNGDIVYASLDDLNDKLSFSEPISKIIISTSKGSDILYQGSGLLEEYKKTIYVNLPQNLLNEGYNNVTLNFYDLAGNSNSVNFIISLKTVNLSVSLLSIQNDSNLKYFYDPLYQDFLQNSIWTKDENFILKLKTNKPAICFYSENLLSFKDLSEYLASNLDKFETNDDLTFTKNISVGDYKKIYVACVDKAYPSDIVYLSEVLGLGKSLITIKKYDNNNLEKISFLPDTYVTSVPFNMSLKTSTPAFCFFNLNGTSVPFDASSDFIDHFKSLDLEDGSYTVKYNCFDRVWNKISGSEEIKIDTLHGVKIINYTPKYTQNNNVNIKLTLSENAECRFSLNRTSINNYNNLSTINVNNLVGEFSLSNLKDGDNYVYIYCKKDDLVGESSIDIIYDSKGLIINKVKFLSDLGIKSDYVKNSNNFKVSINYSTLIPLKYFEISIKNKNGSEIFKNNFTSSIISIASNASDGDTLNIRGFNIINLGPPAITKTINVDNTSPEVIYKKLDSSHISLSCNDDLSGCNAIYYGFSSTAINCQPTLLYPLNNSNNQEINNTNTTIQENNGVKILNGSAYVCIKAFDNVGNTKLDLFTINNDFDNFQGNLSLNSSNISESYFNNTINNTNNLANNTENDSLDNLDLYNNQDYDNQTQPTDNTLTYTLLGALALLLIGVGSGGYYAYRKGYLNKELEKLGLMPPGSNKTSKINNKRGISFSSKPIKGFNSKNVKSGSYYDSHLEKLNKFLDKQMEKADNVFSKFDSKNSSLDIGSNKTKTKTLFSGKKIGSHKYSKEELEKFDEFYKSSEKVSSIGNLDDAEDLQKEAEKFEQYLKEKNSKKSENKRSKDNK
jgi:hypothetical protein